MAMVTDRNPRFTSQFWQELFKWLDTQLRMSSMAHPPTDGQKERVNQSLEDYIRCYVQADQKDWVVISICWNFVITPLNILPLVFLLLN